MLEKHPLPNPLIIDCLKADYRIEVATLRFLPWGADPNVSIYKAQARDRTSYFIKLKQGHNPDLSVEILELLQQAGIQLIIPPIQSIHGEPTQKIGDYTLIVYPFVDGKNGFDRALTETQWIQLGKALRQIHEINVPPSIKSLIRKETYSSKWRDAIRSLDRHFDAEPIDEVAAKLLKFIKKNRSAIHRLVDRAEQLGQKIQNRSHPFVLCHSDLHAGNVLLNRKGALYIVDWDAPVMAPKERDLMFIGGGVGNVWNQPIEEKLFYKGYGNREVDLALLAYYRHERIVEDMAIYGRELLLTTAKKKDRPEMYKQFIAQFEPQGVVDIAFKTDEDPEYLRDLN